MSPLPLIVAGLCTPERRRYAAGLARATGRGLLELAGGAGPVAGATPVRIARDRTELDHVVIDADVDVDVQHLDVVTRRPAAALVCVVDARHLLDDLRDGAPLDEHAAAGDDRGDVGARARRAAHLLESADLVAFVQWEDVDTPRLSLLMALVSHLAPTARVRLSRGPAEDARALLADRPAPDERAERAGWVRLLNDEHDPHLTDRRIDSLRYERLRPFHPERLVRALDEIDAGGHGRMLRSAGFCRIATRPGILARWEHVGSAIWIDPLDAGLESAATGQDLVITGLDLRAGDLVATLDRALLTDEELEAGAEQWRGYPDPLPAWDPAPSDAVRRWPRAPGGEDH